MTSFDDYDDYDVSVEKNIIYYKGIPIGSVCDIINSHKKLLIKEKEECERHREQERAMLEGDREKAIENSLDLGNVLTVYVCRAESGSISRSTKTKPCHLRLTDNHCPGCLGEYELKLGVLQKKFFEAME